MRESDTIGFIGTGAMGSALMRGFLAAELISPPHIIASDTDPAKAAALASELGIVQTDSNLDVAERAQIIFLAVKPAAIEDVMAQIGSQLRKGQVVVSIAAGVPLSRLRAQVQEGEVCLVRVMPNTPALVGKGMSGVAFEAGVPEDIRQRIMQLLEAVGEAIAVKEELMDAVTGLSGSGPAFVFMAIEALIEGGVEAGLSRDIAQQLAVQTVLGAASLLKKTGQQPSAAKDMVASPGGTTVAGLAVLEAGGFHANLAQAVVRAAERSRELSK